MKARSKLTKGVQLCIDYFGILANTDLMLCLPQLRFGPYTILAWTAQSINCHIALKAMFYLLNIAFINIVLYRNVIIHKRTHTWKFTYVKNTKYAKIQIKTERINYRTHNGHM